MKEKIDYDKVDGVGVCLKCDKQYYNNYTDCPHEGLTFYE